MASSATRETAARMGYIAETLADTGGADGLSPSAVNERIRRLTSSGALRRFTVDVEPEALGLPVLAFVWVGLAPGADEAGFRAFAAGHPAMANATM